MLLVKFKHIARLLLQKGPFKKLWLIAFIWLSFVFLSTLIYFLIGFGDYSLFDCFYMVIISITSTGYGEITDFTKHPEGRWFTVFVILLGYLVFAFFISILSELLVTGEFGRYFRKRRVKKMVKHFKNHYIVCGFDEMGFSVAREIYATFNQLVIVDEREHIHTLVSERISPKVPVIKGDPSKEHVLLEAGIDKAAALILTLPEDKDNLFALVNGKSLNPAIKIATKVVHEDNIHKFKNAGAFKIISPDTIGGMRLASELIRPAVTNFLDIMLRSKDKNLRIGEIEIDNKWAGKTIAQNKFSEKANVLVMAVAYNDSDFTYNPKPDTMLEKGWKLIILGETKDIATLQNLETE